MQDGKALQAGTSHNLGQNFAKAFEVKYQDEKQAWQYCWQTSWGVSTRLVGALIMAHSDDQGLVVPPRLAPIEVVVIPIYSKDDQRAAVFAYLDEVKARLAGQVTFHVDDRDQFKPGWKYAEWELRGVPLRLEIGPRDVEKRGAVLVRRDTRQKQMVAFDSLVPVVRDSLQAMQRELFQKALDFRAANTRFLETYDEFKEAMQAEGGFVWAHWCGGAGCEQAVSEETKATIRTVPFDAADGLETPGAPPPEPGRCVHCGQASPRRVLWAKAY